MMNWKTWLWTSVAVVLGFCMVLAFAVPSALAAEGDKKLRIGVPLTYGPQNQPWQRGAARLLERLEEHKVEIVAMRGVPSSDSERSVMRRLMQMKVDALPIGIYTNRSESISLVKEAHEKGIKTVGWITYAVDSPSVLEDAWSVAVTLCHKMVQNTGGEGAVVYTAESPGFYPPFDMMGTFLEGFLKYQPRMKNLGYIDGGVSTQDQISLNRRNFSAFFRAHPEKGSVKVLMSFWWPPTVGAIKAMRELGRDKEGIQVYNQYVSKTFYEEMARPDTPVVGTTDTDWRWICEKLADVLVAMAKGEEIPKETIFWSPVPWYPKAQAKELLEWITKTDEWTHKKLREYGG
jgi:ABC-type sugar transport system substrate-binding protein